MPIEFCLCGAGVPSGLNKGNFSLAIMHIGSEAVWFYSSWGAGRPNCSFRIAEIMHQRTKVGELLECFIIFKP